MGQRYPAGVAHLRMQDGKCPECGGLPSIHAVRGNMWDPWMQTCNLLRRGVEERIEQYEQDRKEHK